MAAPLKIDPAPGFEHLNLTELRKILKTGRRLTPAEDSPFGLYDREGHLVATAPSEAKDFLQGCFLRPRCYLYTYDGVPELPKELLEQARRAGQRLKSKMPSIPQGSEMPDLAAIMAATDAEATARDTELLRWVAGPRESN